jgi:hypothetical protein
MPRFRPRSPADSGLCDMPLSPETVRWLCGDVTRLCHFFTGPNLRLEWEDRPDDVSVWEVFQGRLLDPAHTRQRRTFEVWNVYQLTDEGRSGEPLLSLKWDHDANQMHVVRGIDSYVHEGYDSGDGVFLTRERRKWVRELVGTVELGRFRDLEELRDELICLLFNAVVGTSRLPLAPVEAPLPGFSFGELFYCFRSDEPITAAPLSSWKEVLQEMRVPDLSARERVKLLETVVRSAAPIDLEDAAILFAAPWPGEESWREFDAILYRWREYARLLRLLFNEVSLSPYTDLAGKVLAFVNHLATFSYLPSSEGLSFLESLLRQNGRHLTAYDLITFHHRGANYPDALLLDELCKEYLSLIDSRPQLFLDTTEDDESVQTVKRRRRRALRQAWLHRRAYEGHPVPDAPTSPGEQTRVLPPDYPRVSEEQLLQPATRTRQLFADDPLTNHLTPNVAKVLRQSLADLEHPDELRELGMALYLDRPFNFGKPPAEPDGTLLLSAEAFSRSLALQRLHNLPRWFAPIADAIPPGCVERLQNLPVAGLPLDRIGSPARPGIISLTDARLASPDFVFLRTTVSTVRNFLALYDVTPLAERFDVTFLTEGRRVLIARAPRGDGVIVYDEALRPRLEMHVPANRGYERRAGYEYPAAGLWVVRVGDVDLRDHPIVLQVR